MSQQQIIDDILSQAKSEAELIRRQGSEALERRKVSLVESEARIAAEANARISGQESVIRNRWERNSVQEERRIQLELQDRTVKDVMSRVRERLSALSNTDDFEPILREWAIEAIVGLGLERGATAVLRSSERERARISAGVDDIRAKVEQITGGPVRVIQDTTALKEGTVGVVALDEAGKRAFSNTLDDRLRRSAQEIHRIVIMNVFSGSNV